MVMKDFLYKLSDFVRDEGGRLSSMRLLFLVWGVGTLVVWAYLCIKAAAFIALPTSVMAFIISLVGGKVLQSYTETLPPVPSVTETDAIVVDNSSKNDTLAP